MVNGRVMKTEDATKMTASKVDTSRHVVNTLPKSSRRTCMLQTVLQLQCALYALSDITASQQGGISQCASIDILPAVPRAGLIQHRHVVLGCVHSACSNGVKDKV